MNRLDTRGSDAAGTAGADRLDGVPGQHRPPDVRTARAPASGKSRSLARSAALFGRLLPGPRRTPFTFWYGLVLLGTALLAEHAEPATVSVLLRESSTDVAHLARTPALVLVASALWVAGGLLSPYTIGFVLVLTALERRVGGLRTAGIFLLGHVLATLLTEIPVGLAVAVGHLPETSLHRLDYGISFGIMASAGALAGLLPPLARWILLTAIGAALLQDLLEFADPITDWGHVLALLIGVACWPALRSRRVRSVTCAGRCSRP
ncbi:rhomboid-like protein [Streptomyces sp. NPDC093109]|uniref:rhomboid-like protein n=1 Tax=Streptomyces sp. NPDC093109 TaxID=3154977 RepID=UPI00344C7242